MRLLDPWCLCQEPQRRRKYPNLTTSTLTGPDSGVWSLRLAHLVCHDFRKDATLKALKERTARLALKKITRKGKFLH